MPATQHKPTTVKLQQMFISSHDCARCLYTATSDLPQGLGLILLLALWFVNNDWLLAAKYGTGSS